MLRICDCGLQLFKERIRGKRLFLWGGGNRGKLCYEEWGIREDVVEIADNDEQKWNKAWHTDSRILCVNRERMISDICTYGINNCILLITAAFYAMDIIDELDEVDCLSGLETYLAVLVSEYYAPQEFEFTKGIQRIPKKIHYCWFGGKEIPDRLKVYMGTWEQFCPDYEIVRWDESNYDVTKNQYMHEAYSAGKYGFVPDYARLDIIYSHGGIYLDTDVELCRNLDGLLCDDSFFAVEWEGSVNAGVGFGAVAQNPIIGDMLKVYENEHFIDKDGYMNLKPCHYYQSPVLKKYGFEITQRYQQIGGNVLYPCEVLAPVAAYSGAKRFTERTHSVHHSQVSWVPEGERAARARFRNRIRSRLDENGHIFVSVTGGAEGEDGNETVRTRGGRAACNIMFLRQMGACA